MDLLVDTPGGRGILCAATSGNGMLVHCSMWLPKNVIISTLASSGVVVLLVCSGCAKTQITPGATQLQRDVSRDDGSHTITTKTTIKVTTPSPGVNR